MKRASYRFGVEWIALNDEPGDVLPNANAHENARSYISTMLLADLFGVDPARVADDILRCRAKAQKAGDLP